MHVSGKRLASPRRALPVVGLLLVGLTLWFGQSGCQQTEAPTSTKVTVGIQVSPAMTLVMVAKDRGFFEREKLDVELKEFTAGKFALQAFWVALSISLSPGKFRFAWRRCRATSCG